MSAPPPGTITFLFTDIAGSSLRFEQQGSAMHEALARHDALLRDAIERNGGELFKTWGDAFVAAFEAARAAVRAALEAQLALYEAPDDSGIGALPVRMALHSGPAEKRGADYFGDTLNRASRLLRVAHGGQILLSGTTADLVGPAIPPHARMVDLGVHRLRDLHRTERVYQLQHPELPAGLPPLLSLEQMPTNLPQQSTSFIGREREIADVKVELASTRLLTLTGAGGCGKTRLALQVGAEVLDEYPDGVWLAELAELTDAGLVPATVCAALRIPHEQCQEPLPALSEYVRHRRMLLILDNCEHLMESCAEAVEHLLRESASVRILTTSRERLQLGGETVFRVPSLKIPIDGLDGDRALEAVMHTESTRLFVERARNAHDAFRLTTRGGRAIVEICRRLDGIPLAIELAAALTSVMPPEEIEANLHDFFRILTRGSRTAMERHRTLRGAIQWSYDLLTPQERTLFARLSVFRGGWTISAAQQVCAGGQINAWDVLDELSRLVDKSLVYRDDVETGSARYRMLESIRQFAQEKLEEAGETDVTRKAHLDYYLSLGEEAEPHVQGPDQNRYLELLEREHDNLRAALAASTDEALLRLATAIHRFWLVRGHLAEGRGWLERALQQDEIVANARRAKACNASGVLCWAQGDFPAALAHFKRALEIARRVDDREMLPAYLNNIAMLQSEMGECTSARKRYEEALELYRKAGDTRRVGIVLGNLGADAIVLGDYANARKWLEMALEVHTKVDNRADMAECEANLALLDIRTADTRNARSHLQNCIQYRQDLRDMRGIATAHDLMALADASDGECHSAVRRLGTADALRKHLGVVLNPQDPDGILAATARCRDELSGEEFERLWQAGAADAELLVWGTP